MTSTSKETSPDLLKELQEWALAAGRAFQSSQTGYVHLYYGEEQTEAQTIPLVENALFALALLCSRMAEKMHEAKKIIKGLISFQNLQTTDYGNFPVYLHEYPQCFDPTLALQLLAPFYWILKSFGRILGADLKIQLENASQLALEYSLNSHRVKPFSYSLAIRLFASQCAYGELLGNISWQKMGKESLDFLAQRQLEDWHTTKHLADILVGLQMVYPSLPDSPWSPFWQRIEQTWHSSLACYIGPCIREWQKQENPQANLYDLFGGFFAGRFSQRAASSNRHHLHGILIQPSLNKFYSQSSTFSAQGTWGQEFWNIVGCSSWTCTLLEKKSSYQPTIDKTYTPFRLIWGNLHCLHSFVCQGGNIEKFGYDFQNRENSFILTFDLREQLAETENTSRREIEFFIDFQPTIHFLIDRLPTTVFELDQEIQISLDHYRLLISFELTQGKGEFLGHIMRGNRPSQLEKKGEKRFQAYDWTFL